MKYTQWAYLPSVGQFGRLENKACFDKMLFKHSCERICMACSYMNYWTGLSLEDMQQIIRTGADSMLQVALEGGGASRKMSHSPTTRSA